MSKVNVKLSKKELGSILSALSYSMESDIGDPLKEDVKLFRKLKEIYIDSGFGSKKDYPELWQD